MAQPFFFFRDHPHHILPKTLVASHTYILISSYDIFIKLLILALTEAQAMLTPNTFSIIASMVTASILYAVPLQAQSTPQTLEQSCTRGDAHACFEAGVHHRTQAHTTTALYYFTEGCKLDELDACVEVALSVQSGDEKTPANPKKAAELLKGLCDRGHDLGCAKLGEAYTKGFGVEQDLIISRSLLEPSCERDFAQACTALGKSYAHDELEQGYTLTMQHFDKGCELGDGAGCFFAGLYSTQTSSSAHTRFSAYMERACELGEQAACLMKKTYSSDVQPMKLDIDKTLELFEDACTQGTTSLCL